MFFQVSQGNRNKSKSKQIGPNQTYKLLHSKGNHKQNEKTTYRMGETIFAHDKRLTSKKMTKQGFIPKLQQ